LGYRYHNGGHTDAPDWPAFIQFAAKYFNSKAPADVTRETEITRSANSVKIANISVYNLRAPLTYAAKNLRAGVTLANATGKTPEGDPCITLPAGLKPGEYVRILLEFTSSSGSATPSYVPAVYSGGN
jgi:hypothetical protein